MTTKAYRCICCLRKTKAQPVICCGIPLARAADAVVRFCPDCQKEWRPDPPPITLTALPEEVQLAVIAHDLPRQS